LKVVDSTAKTVIMVTHDVDEAIYLADRIVLMTDGPAATVGEIITTPFGRPRDRSILKHPEYRKQRSRIIDFLEHHANQSTVGVREEKRTTHLHVQSEAAVSTAQT
jgi:ABC-type nitrate/sulfonate/bicarbonate transport system ATPase subunit